MIYEIIDMSAHLIQYDSIRSTGYRIIATMSFLIDLKKIFAGYEPANDCSLQFQSISSSNYSKLL